MEQNNEIECYETLQWDTGTPGVQLIQGESEYLEDGTIIANHDNLDQIDPSNLIYMTEDGQTIGISDLIEESQAETSTEIVPEAGEIQDYTECEVTEEIITNDWVQGEECVQVTVDQIGQGDIQQPEDEITVPLPEAQDEYTASRPYPCDFCSRRFRKKANLMNHMIAHQNDRPHVCRLCNARYIRKSDLLNHLKTHAYTEDGYDGEEDHDLANFLSEELNYNRKMIDLEELLASPNAFASTSVGTINKKNSYNKTSNRSKQPNHLGSRPFKSTKKAKKKPKPNNTKNLYLRTPLKLEDEPVGPPKYPITNPDKPFVCQHCGVAFARSKALTSHTRLHSGDVIHECNTCGIQFYDKSEYKSHMARHYVKEEPVNVSAVLDEIDDEATESDVEVGNYDDTLFECRICSLSFHKIELFEKHMTAHELNDRKTIATKNLDDTFSDRHCCNVCGDTFDEALDLLAHAEIHARTDDNLFKCLLCGEQFREESNIKLHISEMHRYELTDNTCRLCGKLCKDGRSLMRHSWDHSVDGSSFSCARCAKTFHNKARLKRHMTSHKNKTVVCDTCGEELPDGRSLMNHRHSHTKSSSQQFACTECKKTFGSRSSQQIHMRIHTGEKPYGCRYCWKAFADGGTLRKHERIHTGEKPYACPVCPRAFNQRVVLREHIRSHHSAPDLKVGSVTCPYLCPVCSETFATSQDLIVHLIHHSDLNTQAKRQPVVGPRKYKRRRGIDVSRPEMISKRSDTIDLESLTEPSYEDELYEESIPEMTVDDYVALTFRQSVPGKIGKQEDFMIPDEIMPESGQMEEKDMELNEPLEAFSKKSRSKMIHTEKTRSQGGYSGRRTKPLVTKAIKQDLLDVPLTDKMTAETFPLLDDGKPLIKQETSLVDDSFLLDIVKNNKYTEKFNSDIVNDLKEILQSPVKGPKQESPKIQEGKSEVKLLESPSRPKRNIKPTYKALDIVKSSGYSSRIRIQSRKQEELKKQESQSNKCQICGDSFETRLQLTNHVQVHI